MNEKVLRHKEICDGLNELYARKNHDYGDSFHTTFVEEGLATIESISERSTLWFCGSCVNSSASATRGLKNSMTTSPAASRL